MQTNYTLRAIEVLEEVAETMRRKSEDYTSDVIGDDAYFPQGWEIAPNAVLINTKLQRYVASVAGGEDNTPYDCLIDLIAYAARAHARLEETDTSNGDMSEAEYLRQQGCYMDDEDLGDLEQYIPVLTAEEADQMRAEAVASNFPCKEEEAEMQARLRSTDDREVSTAPLDAFKALQIRIRQIKEGDPYPMDASRMLTEEECAFMDIVWDYDTDSPNFVSARLGRQIKDQLNDAINESHDEEVNRVYNDLHGDFSADMDELIEQYRGYNSVLDDNQLSQIIYDVLKDKKREV